MAFFTYVGILLVSMIVYAVLPQAEANGSREQVNKIPFLYEAVFENKLDRIAPVFMEKQYTYEYEKKQMRILITASNEPNVIAIKRKAVNDDRVDIIHYATPLLIEGMEVVEYTDSPEVMVEGDSFYIHFPDYIEQKFLAYKNEFTIVQFTEQDFWVNDEIVRGEHLIYIEVPKDVEVIDGEFLNVHYVD
ncbi:hypothetical protein ACLIBH_00475 [Virgibacillus sp. W0430]|uniref:hypothetical protein n=1 Tax=Virgibacillus sp. W0430 TaxID=3391580 RepID=UPI003F4652C4